jgi:hypothetical protein
MTTRKTPKFMNGLSVDALESSPVNVDGWEASDLDGFGGNDSWRFWEAVKCDECGEIVVRENGGGEGRHSDVDSDRECGGLVPEASGPMMNYWYPVRLRDPEAAARAIAHLPLCVVEVNGDTGLALTGGGMDLSWEICEAFLALSFYPPTHFAALPEMAGRGRSAADKRLMRACEESFRVSMQWAQSGIKRLRDMRKRAIAK